MSKQNAQLTEAIKAAGRALLALAIIVATFLFVMIRLIADALRIAFSLLCKLSKPILYAAIVAAEIAVIVVTFPLVWSAYGGDVPALFPAAVVCVIPAAVALLSGVGFQALLAAAAVTLIVGQVIGITDPLVRSLLLTGAIAGCVIFKFHESESTQNVEQTQ